MKKYRVRVTTNAFEDMSSIKLYITNELCNGQAAEKIINEFYEAIDSLSSMPQRHKVISEEIMPIAIGLRRVPVGNYNIFYRWLEDEGEVSIIRVLYDKREWKSLV